MSEKFVIGLDYGTDSVRSVIVSTDNGEIAGTSVYEYPRWKKGLYCDPASNRFRQHPLDYTESLTEAVTAAVREADAARAGKSSIAPIAVSVGSPDKGPPFRGATDEGLSSGPGRRILA